ncbi:MAG: hypothetical protein B7Z42_16085, partial [Brevundimonas sp. 12-68-7]
MATKTYPFDVVDFFKDDEDIAGYLEEMLAIDDPRLLGAVPLLAQRVHAASRCGLELLVRADTLA